jgi:hypothetical protein
VAQGFEFEQRVAFRPEAAEEILRGVPAGPGVFALRGEREGDEPYLTRAADMRRRLRRLLAPPEAVDEQGRPVLSKRLNLRARVRWIEWTATGSEFESTVVLYCAARAAFGVEAARKRLRLYPPYFLRVTMQHDHPRVYATNRLSARGLGETFGPFPSRAAAERYCDAVLDLFKLRRCHEDLQVHPEHPGCVYGEMKKCMEPCKGACSAEEYAREADAVRAFFATRGESMLGKIGEERDAASEAMDFERAAELHKQYEKVKAAASLADEIVRPVTELRAVVEQEAARREDGSGREDAAVFLFANGRIAGPERLSTLGVRAVREQTAVGSSLFAQPLMLAAVPLEDEGAGEPADRQAGEGGRPVQEKEAHQYASNPVVQLVSEETSQQASGPVGQQASLLAEERVGEGGRPGERIHQSASNPAVQLSSGETSQRASGPVGQQASLSPEERARAVLARLEERAGPVDAGERGDFLALFRRWYYRPEKQRAGEVFLPNADGSWPVRRILNGAARVVLGPPGELPAVEREKFAGMKTKVIHPGREGVERVVPVLPKRARRKGVTPKDVEGAGE